MSETIYIFLADGFEEIEAITPIDLFRRAKLDVVTVSVTGKNEVNGAHGIKIQADKKFEEIEFDPKNLLLLLPGGQPGTDHLNAHDGLKKLLKSQYENNGLLAAICAAPLVLGGLGFLQDKEAICYPGVESSLTGAVISGKEVVKSGNIITSKGLGVAINFSLKIIEEIRGKAVADKIASSIGYK